MKIIDSFFALKSHLNSVWQKLTLLFIENSELQVWSTRDRNGEICWYAYDPSTRRSACFGSEDDMRAWIEKRLYL